MPEKKKLSNLFVNLFGLGDFGFQLMVNLEIMFFVLFLTDAARFNADQVTFIGTITGIFDIFWVFVAGLIVQRTNFKRGKLRSWLLYAPPLVWATFIFQFWGFSGNTTVAEWLVIFGFVASHLIWNCAYTAHIAMISQYTDEIQQRTKMSSGRMVFQALGKIVFSLVAVPMIVSFSGAFGAEPGARNAQGYTITAIILTLVMVACYFIIYFISKPYETAAADAPKAVAPHKPPVWKSIVNAVTNSQLVVLALSDFGRCFAFYLVTAVTSYYFRVVLGSMELFQTYLLWINIAAAVFAFIAPWIAKTIGKKNTYYFGMIGYTVCLFVVYFFQNVTLFMIVMVLASGILQLSFSMGTAMFADTVIYGEWKKGVNDRGFIMGLYSFPIKTSILVRATFLGIMLKAMSYTPDAVTPQMVVGIKNLFTIYPAIVLGICTVFGFVFYKLTDKKVAQLSDEIAARKQEQA